MSTVLYCRPSDILTPEATLSLTSGTANADFPLANAQDKKAHTVFKSTGTAATIRSHWSSPVTIEGIALVYHKLAGATVTISNPAGFSKALTIPANSEDGHCLDPWDDYRDLDDTTDDDWDITISGVTGVVTIGEILWIETLREAVLDIGPSFDDQQASLIQPTDYHPHANVYSMATRCRKFRGHCWLATVADDLLSLHRDARGPVRPFLLVPDSDKNDALYAHWATDLQRQVEALARGTGARMTDVEFVEAIRGLPL